MDEVSLQISYQHLIDFFDKSSMPFFSATRGGKRLFFNEAVCRLVGYSREELRTAARARRVFKDWIDLIKNKQDQAVRSGKQQTFEIPYFRKDGATIPLEIHLHSRKITDEEGETDLYYAFVIDKSESREMERQQREALEAQRVSEEKFSRAFKYLPNMVCITSLDGTYQDISDSFSELLGYRRDEVIGRNTNDYGWIRTKDREEYLARLERHGYVRDLESDFRRKNGEILTALLSTVKIQIDGSEYLLSSINDITRRKKAEEALRRSEEKFNKAFHALPITMAISTPDGVYVDVNSASTEIMGYTREETIGRSSSDFLWVDPRDREVFAAVLNRQGFIRDMEFNLRHKSGDVVIALISAVKIEIEGSSYILSTINDITKRRQAEEALRESEERYRKFINSTSDIVFVKDDNHRYIIVNPELAAFFGRPVEEIVGKTDFDLMPPDAARQCEYTDLQAKALATVVIGEEPIGDRVYETHKFPVELSSGRTGVGGFIRDITERKQAEILLKEAHEELSRSYDRLREANDELEGKVAERTQELLAVNEELQAINAELVETNATLENQIEVRKRVEEKLANTNQELADALTELRETQSQLVQSEKMASLGTLVAGVAHEINSPVGVGVTAVSHLGKITREFAHLLESGPIQRKDVDTYIEDILDAADIVQSNLNRAAKMISSFKQVAADQSSEEKRSFNVREYIGAILTSLQPELKKTRHTVKIDCKEQIIINSYPGAFSQIVTNLLMNSLMHAYEPGEAGKIAFKVLLNGDNLLLTYSDDGRGMDKEVRQRIFDPFFTTRRGTGGTGLGLYIVYNLVNQVFNGSIYCLSEPGQGVTFHLQLKL